jgi:hypothetical protein
MWQTDSAGGIHMKTTIKTTMIACSLLSFIAAAVYVLIGTTVVSIPKFGTEEAPGAVFYLAAACYLVGGLLVQRGRRWLWTVGLAANSYVICIFFLAYHREPEMMLSTAGLASKISQVLLEAGLIYLVAAGRNRIQLQNMEGS